MKSGKSLSILSGVDVFRGFAGLSPPFAECPGIGVKDNANFYQSTPAGAVWDQAAPVVYITASALPAALHTSVSIN
jgi:hypothetical protein